MFDGIEDNYYLKDTSNNNIDFESTDLKEAILIISKSTSFSTQIIKEAIKNISNVSTSFDNLSNELDIFSQRMEEMKISFSRDDNDYKSYTPRFGVFCSFLPSYR